MAKYIIQDWTGEEKTGFGKFKTFDDANIALDEHCDEIVKRDYPTVDNLSDSFGDLLDIERGEYVIVEIKE